mgnify:CR=1 FL=1
MTVVSDVRATIAALRREVCALHEQLTRYQLVVWTAGNVSARVPGHDLLVIKPSGVDYDAGLEWSTEIHDNAGAAAAGSSTSRRASGSMIRRPSTASVSWPSLPPGETSGSVRIPSVTFRQSAPTPPDGA